MKSTDDRTRINESIRVREVRLIDENGSQIGIVPTSKALGIAREKGYDLVEVAPNSKPPVCRIMDYGKYVYDQQKKAKAAKKKQHTVQVKEIRFRPKIEEHDYDFKLKHIREFLQQGFKVKIMIRFRGRELAHKDMGFKVLEQLEEDISDIGKLEVPGKMENRAINAVVAPLSGSSGADKEK
ncbi:MAG: translation initiation factor IF-3 [candidate division Zixibacteria bacterium]|nr:translation initiation factor IF-3 [candidate division Zixibacteria bacterium]